MRWLPVLCLMISVSLFAQDETAHVWTFGGEFFEEGREILQHTDGGFCVVGTTGTVGENTNMLLMRFDPEMNCVFSSVYGDSGVEKGYSICPAMDGGWMLCGMTLNLDNGSYDVYVVHADDSGNVLWSKKIGGAGWDFGYRIIRVGEGYAVAGASYSYSDNGSDAIIMFISQAGELTHYWLFDQGGDEEWTDIDLLEDGSILVTGTLSSGGDQRAVLRSYDPEGGENWTYTKSVEGFNTRGIGCAVAGGNLFYTAITEAEGVETACRGKLNTDGVELSFIQQIQDGNYYFGQPFATGTSVVYPGNTTNYGAGGQDATIFMWNQSGPFIGAPTFGGGQHETLFHGIATESGELYCTGSYTSFSDGVEQLAIIRLSAVYNGDYIKTTDYDGDCVSYLTVDSPPQHDCGDPVFICCRDLQGRVVYTGDPTELEIHLSGPGLYIMELQDASGCVSVMKKFVTMP